ncbi:chromosomal replication initiator protein DnaA [Bartonella birtlesii]|uniref:Chromosomal replication initiator protein DnaA n=1 Tax=Bartonella birtlesii LL-WM9 TaxID=1094552 RepID=J0Q0W0_9HYPH|nr:chromosomal replication initiator protein DnaA [Bartonella birtlesii]EJF76164.1 chromosomal replication initiator protein dnaA [Bartonella birtlesii LL-WM9]
MVDKLNSKANSFKRVSVNILSAEKIIKMTDSGGAVSKNGSGESPIISQEEGEAAFVRVMAQLKVQVGIEAYTSWFGRVKLAEYSRNLVKLSVPTAFLRSWINNHYGSLLTNLWKQENSAILRVEVIVRGMKRVSGGVVCKTNTAPMVLEEQTTPSFVESYTENPVKSVQTGVFGSPLDSRYNFENFVEGSSNRVALAAARSIAEGHKSALRFNPLFVHASVGLGKTHLLQAIAAAALKRLTPARVIYLTAEYFMWRFATAIRDNDALSFKEQLRDIDLLIIDDMQFLQGKSIQHEFCHLLNMLLDSAKQVVVAADRPPAELESLDLRVRSRLQGGVALEIEAPDYEMRLKMLQQRLKVAQQDDSMLSISDDILEYIARTVLGSGRDIEGAFNQLLFRQSFESDLSLERIDELLGHLTRSGEPKRIRIEEIQRTVARHYNVSKQDLLSNRRTRTVVKPRQVAMYLAKMLTPRSLPEIGRRFGGRDHTTVLHAVRKIEDLICGDQTLAKELELLKRLIGEQAA